MTALKLHRLDEMAGIEAAYVGPPLSAGPLPALLYFSLSAHDSLALDPFNQPVEYLSGLPMRIFSVTLPGHENNLPPTEALRVWASALTEGRPLMTEFVGKVRELVLALEKQGALVPGKLAVSGLSRGAFMAAHVAAALPQVGWVLGFAPLTRLENAKEFQDIAELPNVRALALDTLVQELSERCVRFYIGNLDTRVNTRSCFDFIETLSQTASENRIRSPQVELIIGPSIGKDGHGTSKEVFHHGAQWIAEKLGAIDVL